MTNAESHFGIGMSGRIEQWMDTAREADANYKANRYAISVENEDKGRPLTPFTEAQVEANIKVGRWSLEKHPKIPRKICTSPTSGGLGWHAMWGAPSDWTPSRGKTCPGATRIRQLKSEIFPDILREVPKVKKHAIAIVVRDVNGLDAGAAQVYRSRLSTLVGMDIPVSGYSKDLSVSHAVIIGSTEGMDLNTFDSHTLYQGADRKSTGEMIDQLLGG
jgi:hypothetical protein